MMAREDDDKKSLPRDHLLVLAKKQPLVRHSIASA